MDKPEELKEWTAILEKYNSSLIELFDVAEKDVLSKTYLRDVVKKLVDILQVKYGALGLLGESQRFVNFIHVGISDKNLIRIFNFGFTTKTEGGDFGLHASALTALEMGGNLIATSEGPDKGSTFTLKLPRNREKIS